MVYAPRREYDHNGTRIYTEMHTADWWWDLQVLLCSLFYVKAYQYIIESTPGRGDCGFNYWDGRSDESYQLPRRQETRAGLYDDWKSFVENTQPAWFDVDSACWAIAHSGQARKVL